MSSIEIEEYSNAFPSNWTTKENIWNPITSNMQLNKVSDVSLRPSHSEGKTVADQTSLEREGIVIRDFACPSEPRQQGNRTAVTPDCDYSEKTQRLLPAGPTIPTKMDLEACNPPDRRIADIDLAGVEDYTPIYPSNWSLMPGNQPTPILAPPSAAENQHRKRASSNWGEATPKWSNRRAAFESARSNSTPPADEPPKRIPPKSSNSERKPPPREGFRQGKDVVSWLPPLPVLGRGSSSRDVGGTSRRARLSIPISHSSTYSTVPADLFSNTEAALPDRRPSGSTYSSLGS